MLGDLGKLIGAKGFKNAQSPKNRTDLVTLVGRNGYMWVGSGNHGGK